MICLITAVTGIRRKIKKDTQKKEVFERCRVVFQSVGKQGKSSMFLLVRRFEVIYRIELPKNTAVDGQK